MDFDVAQGEIDQKNQVFWNELCGSTLAKYLGVVDSSPASLEKFDQYYMDLYPYLKKYLPIQEMVGKKVLEIGLGYGTVGQYLSINGAEYYGLDIAQNAVEMTKHRLQQNGLDGYVKTGSMLDCPFQDNYFDYVVSIGCFHHTGNMQKCIDQTYRILKPGGMAIVMVYNKFSLRQWARWPKITARNTVLQLLNKGNSSKSLTSQRQAYDASVNATHAAPETEFFSIRELKKIFSKFNRIQATRENFDDYFKIEFIKKYTMQFGPRADYLNSMWARFLGLDVYIQAIK